LTLFASNATFKFLVDLLTEESKEIGTSDETETLVDNVVELLIICDKKNSNLFKQDEKKILDYFTVTMWGINMIYKTLPSVNISFKIIGIILLKVNTHLSKGYGIDRTN